MKQLLLMGSFLFSFCAMAQEFKYDIPKKVVVTQRPDIYTLPLSPQQRDSLIKQFKTDMVKVGSGIHYLPQDGMPCLVPDTKDIVAIPNAWPKMEVPFMSQTPNPALPNRPSVIVPKNDTK